MPVSPSQIIWDMPPNACFSRHSEGDFLRLKDGSIFFAYSRFNGTDHHDDAPSSLVAMISNDEGETWSEPQVIIRAEDFGVQNVMSVSLMRMNNGDVGIFYIVKEEWFVHIMLSRSSDEGRTFSLHIECTLADRPGWFVLNNSRAERLANGRILLPLAYHRTGMNAKTGKTFFDHVACVCILYSNDDGETWKEAPEVIHLSFTGSQSGLQEPGILQLKNGALWGYFRTDKINTNPSPWITGFIGLFHNLLAFLRRFHP